VVTVPSGHSALTQSGRLVGRCAQMILIIVLGSISIDEHGNVAFSTHIKGAGAGGGSTLIRRPGGWIVPQGLIAAFLSTLQSLIFCRH
jgi:hypothetical protein